MPNFRVDSYRPKSTALESMRLLFSGYSVAMQKSKMDADKAYRQRMEVLNIEAHKSNEALKKIQNSTNKVNLQAAQIRARAAEQSFVDSTLGGMMDIYQNGMGSIWNMEDLNTIQQDYMNNLNRMKELGVVSDKGFDVFKTKVAPILSVKALQVEQFKRLNRMSPYKVDAIAKARGLNPSQIAGMGKKAQDDTYTELMASQYSKIGLLKQYENDSAARIKELENAITRGNKENLKNEGSFDAAASKMAMANEYKNLAGIQKEKRFMENNFNDMNGQNLQSYKMDELRRRKINEKSTLLHLASTGIIDSNEAGKRIAAGNVNNELKSIDKAILDGTYSVEEGDRLRDRATKWQEGSGVPTYVDDMSGYTPIQTELGTSARANYDSAMNL